MKHVLSWFIVDLMYELLFFPKSVTAGSLPLAPPGKPKIIIKDLNYLDANMLVIKLYTMESWVMEA